MDAGHGLGPAISDLVIAFDDTTDATKPREKTVTLPADTYSFNLGGVYKYKITETNTAKDNWTYDSSVYYLYITVEENSSNQLVLTNYFITTSEDNSDITAKTTELTFENEYTPMTKLTVAKDVDGTPENATKKFKFTITFNQPDVAQKVMHGTTEVDYGVPYDFYLSDDETAVFDLPAGVTYSITEQGEEYYTGSVVVTEGETTKAPVQGEYKTNLTTTGEVVELTKDGEGNDKGENKVEFTNVYSVTPPTGVGVNTEVIVISGMVLLALAGMFVINRKIRSKKN